MSSGTGRESSSRTASRSGIQRPMEPFLPCQSKGSNLLARTSSGSSQDPNDPWRAARRRPGLRSGKNGGENFGGGEDVIQSRRSRRVHSRMRGSLAWRAESHVAGPLPIPVGKQIDMLGFRTPRMARESMRWRRALGRSVGDQWCSAYAIWEPGRSVSVRYTRENPSGER